MMKTKNLVGSFRLSFGERKSVPTLLHLAKKGKFDAMINLLQGDEHKFYLDECADTANHHGTLNMFMGRSTLQLVMTYRPPVELVNILIQRCREHSPDYCPEDSIDIQGRTPLHIAVEYGCSFETCERLMGDNLPVIMKDQMDRTPLHYACANAKPYPSKLSQRHKPGGRRHLAQIAAQQEADNSYKLILALVTIYPEATIIADMYGKTPIMLAMDHGASRRVIRLLEKVHDRMEQSKCYEDEALVKLLESSMFTITSECFSTEDDVSSVGSCGVSSIEI